MPSSYTPVPVAMTTLTLASDGELRAVASVNGPMKSIADGVAYLMAHPALLSLVEILGNAAGVIGPITALAAPASAVAAVVEACGSGGGGGNGGNDAFNFQATTGGSGGGGARRCVFVVPIFGGETYVATVADAAAAETNGADTTLVRQSTGTVLFTARGGGRGYRGATKDRLEWFNQTDTTVAQRNLYQATLGGLDVARTNVPAGGQIIRSSSNTGNFEPPNAQFGGMGVSRLFSTVGLTGFFGTGGNSPEGFAGGGVGLTGADFTSLYKGGGAGGGGGAGPFGNGGDGGDGSAATDGTVLGAGAGSNAPTASGGGGGGGGGTGESNAASAAAGGAGGSAGSGRMRIWFLRQAP